MHISFVFFFSLSVTKIAWNATALVFVCVFIVQCAVGVHSSIRQQQSRCACYLFSLLLLSIYVYTALHYKTKKCVQTQRWKKTKKKNKKRTSLMTVENISGHQLAMTTMPLMMIATTTSCGEVVFIVHKFFVFLFFIANVKEYDMEKSHCPGCTTMCVCVCVEKTLTTIWNNIVYKICMCKRFALLCVWTAHKHRLLP